VKLVRYSPVSSTTLVPNSIEHLIRLNAGKRTLDLKRGRFLTNDLYGVASAAHDYCSLTYYPSFRYLFDLPIPSPDYSLYQNDKSQIGREPAGVQLTRTWPAFGSHGGAHELILDHNQQITLGNPEELRDGGAIDAYYYDNVQPYTLDLVRAIANGVSSALFGEEFPEVSGGKVTDTGGAVLAWTKGRRWYSVSVANKCFGGLWKLKFWGYTWWDDEDGLVRKFFEPYTERLEFGPCLVAGNSLGQLDPCGVSANIMKAQLERGRTSRRQGADSIYWRVEDCVKHIMKRLYRISDTTFDLTSRRVPLQMVEA
jgi:hypothetical protein